MTVNPTPEDTLARLESRLDRIEARLDRLVGGLEHAAPALAMATDTFDEAVAGAQARGLDLDARAAAAIEVVERVSDPAVLERLMRLVDLAAHLEDTVAMTTDTFDAWAAEQARRGVDLDARAQTALKLVERLTEPATAGALEAMVEALPKLAPVVALATTFEPTTAMLFDMFDEHVKGWVDRGIDAEARFLQVAGLVERLTDPDFHRHLEALLDAAPNLMAATRTGELFGLAVDEVTARPVAPMGLWALVRALNDPEVQQAAGFAIAVARQIGARLPQTTTPART